MSREHEICAVLGDIHSAAQVRSSLSRFPGATITWVESDTVAALELGRRYLLPLIIYDGIQRVFGLESINSFVDDRLLFNDLSRRWKFATAHLSIKKDAERHPEYQEIVHAGMRMVPFMLEELRDYGTNWIPALSKITGEQLFANALETQDFEKARTAWVEWGKAAEFLADR